MLKMYNNMNTCVILICHWLYGLSKEIDHPNTCWLASTQKCWGSTALSCTSNFVTFIYFEVGHYHYICSMFVLDVKHTILFSAWSPVGWHSRMRSFAAGPWSSTAVAALHRITAGTEAFHSGLGQGTLPVQWSTGASPVCACAGWWHDFFCLHWVSHWPGLSGI